MSKKIFRSVIAVAMTVLLVSLVFIIGFLYDYFNRAQIDRLKDELSLAYAGTEQSGIAYFDNYNSDTFRFTLISSDGIVIYDSEIKNGDMENHLDRVEIKEALKKGRGSSSRYSSTLTARTFYEAVRLSNGDILRISTTQATIATLIVGMLPVICAIILFSFVIAIVLSQKTAKSIVKPLETLDLENPNKNNTYEELAPLLSKISRQHKQIESQMRELKQKSDEFKQITDSLSEGMVLIDKDGTVIGINSAAEELFHSGAETVGHSFLTVDRSAAMNNAVNKAVLGEHCEFREERNGREYQFMLSPTLSDGKAVGTVILCIDITDSVFAERNRKEFTANVSHELKTPLQSIIGSAELLENGLVKAKDFYRFVGNIKNEALRLVNLINDIIRLSQLDEKADLPTESIDLYAESLGVVGLLADVAAKKQVSLAVAGEHCTINGVRRYVYEIIYNLCDNAIRYNNAGGKAKIEIHRENDKAVITVSDNGIGIPEEHRCRIFERFYRVDKSHSKETGGTGLGLSIVKHAADCLGGTVALESAVNAGTTVTVTISASEE